MIREMFLYRVIFSALIVISSVLVTRGQEVDYTQYFMNLPTVNPAFTGMDDFFTLNAGVREGWNSYGIKNDNSYVSFFGALNSNNRSARRNNSLRTSDPSRFETIQDENKYRRRHGMGGVLSTRTLDAYRSLGVSFNYAYHMPITSRLNVAFGTRIKYDNQRLNFSNLTVRDDINDQFYQNLLLSGQGSQNSLLADFGVSLYSKKFFIGFSTDNMVVRMLKSEQLFNMNQGLRYKGQAGMYIDLNPYWKLSPGMQVIHQDDFEIRWSGIMRLKYKNLISAGAAYQNDSKISLLLGLSAQKLNINYAYDFYISGLNNFDVNTHELVLGVYLFNPFKLQPRFW